MNKQEYINWVSEIRKKLPLFLHQMQNKRTKGSFKYSYSGDYFNRSAYWGLGNSVFALKIYYTLGIKPDNLDDIKDFIQKFQHKNGEFYDPFVRYLSLPFRLYFMLKDLDINRLDHKFIRRAETRQSISALRLFDLYPHYKFLDFPQNKHDIDSFIQKLNWRIPWGAAAHYSALIFLLAVSDLPDKLALIDIANKSIEKYYQKDGCWYLGNPDAQQKVNGAMKVITGIKAATSIAGFDHGIMKPNRITELIDTALQAASDEHACDNFNLVYVLRYANEIVDSKYRYSEIENFIQTRLDIYKQFYFPEYGSFSFYKNKANKNYYGAIISKGKNEPDIHGTVLFLWGLAVIGNFWNANKITGLKEFIT